ncbi:MAG: hypothetical protein M1819_005940 [Sarea resinae]|nr:MAG: hypothetical protein M1819_005940 [Sarea resinae]
MDESPRKRPRLATPPASETKGPVAAPEINMEDAATMNVLDSSSTAAENQKELDVAISEFVSPDTPGFTGILKKRYTDFLVNEILPSGQVLHLTNTKPPPRVKPVPNDQPNGPNPSLTQSQTDGASDGIPIISPQIEPDVAVAREVPSETSTDPSGPKEDGQDFMLSVEDKALLDSFFGGDTVQSIVNLYRKILDSPKARANSFDKVKSAPISDRGLRTSIHQAIRRIFSSRLESSTDGEGAMVISASGKGSSANSAARGGNGRGNPSDRSLQKPKLGWKELGGEYLHFTLYKENKDTMEVISFLARQLRVKPKDFQFAGTKDRRGVTAQRVSVYRMHAERLAGVNLILRGSQVGDFEYQPHGLDLGDLKGNEFAITLRDCHFHDEAGLNIEEKLNLASNNVAQAMADLRNKGFINYYGLQRFGTFAVRTDTVGVKMLQGDLKGACDAILDYSPVALAAAQHPTDSKHNKVLVSSDDKARAEALHSFKTTGKSQPALDILPRKFSAEAGIIKHLSHPARVNDYQGALQTIARNLRLMYVHAYQSLVWNNAATERLRRWGSQVIEGDLVIVEKHHQVKATENADSKAAPTDEVDDQGEPIIRPDVTDRAASNEDSFIRARPLSKDEVASGQYSVFDIVLPLPGFDVVYPSNALGDFYKTFMASEQGGGLDPYDMRRSWKDVSLSGSYRRLLSRIGEDWECEVRGYVKEDEQMVRTDLEVLREKGKNAKGSDRDRGAASARGPVATTATATAATATATAAAAKMEVEAEVDGAPEEQKKIAVILRFQLDASQYATMALRELMKLGGVKAHKPEYSGR